MKWHFYIYTNNFLCQNYHPSGWLYLSTPIAKLLYGLSTINKGKGIGDTMCDKVKDDFSLFFYLNGRILKEGLKKQDITALLKNQNKLVELDECLKLYNDRIKELRLEKINLEREINALRTIRNNYDGFNL